jgi:CDP-diacylglycerol--serine O-phosphatidyltransferase
MENQILVYYDVNRGQELIQVPAEMWMASLFIALAGVVDFLDGFVARLFKATSAMGKQLDSLADMVSFGVAPGIILYQFLKLAVANEAGALDTSVLWIAPAFLIPAAAAWRLAKFNIATDQDYGFKGVPTPAVGLLIASLPLIYWNAESTAIFEALRNKWILYAFIVLMVVLMVSNLPIMGLKFTNFGVKDNWPKFLLIAIAIVAVLFLKWTAVPAIFIAYVLISLLFQNKTAAVKP